MLKIAVCDDQTTFVNALAKVILRWAASTGTKVSVKKFDDGIPLLHSIEDDGMFDIIFLDVEMERMGGLEAAMKIRETDLLTPIVFVSRYYYHKEAYKVHPFQFIEKPADQEKIDAVMNDFMRMRKQDTETFVYSFNKTRHVMRLVDIMYFKSQKRYVHIFGREENGVVLEQLNNIEKAVEDKNCRFLRIHQSYLINMRYIKEYHRSKVVMANGVVLPISCDRRKKINEVHMMLLDQ